MGIFHVFYYEGFNDHALGDDENPLRKKFISIVEDLKENRRTNLGDVKLIKGDGGVKYFRAKLSDSDRLLFSSIKYNDEDCFVLLEVILNHEYNKSKFLKDRERIKIVKIKSGEGNEKLSDSIEITDVSRLRWLGKFVTFSATQEEIVENPGGMYNLPLVVSGHAGSGKTSVALEKLRRIEEEVEKGKILFITQSENLIKQSKELYEYEYWDEASNQLRTGVPEQIDFLSIHGFLQNITKDVEGKRSIDRNVFSSWLEGICKQAKFNKYKKDADKLFEEFAAVIAGGGLGRDGGKEEYLKLGKRQSIFAEDMRNDVYDIFEEYKKFVKESPDYYDASLVAQECFEKIQSDESREVYDAVIIDEVQDLTRSMLLLILKTLKNNFLLCGDVNQVIHPSFFSASKLKDFLCRYIVNKGTELKICVLERNYRNSQKIIEFANRILHLKNYIFASEDTLTEVEKKYFFMKSEIKNSGNVGLIAANEEIAKKISGSTAYAILVLDGSYKQEAKESFDTPLIFNILEAKGLEFENVILHKFDEAYNKIWNILCPNKSRKAIQAIINEIRSSYNTGNVNASRPKDKTDKSFEEHKFYMNALYVGVTRAIDNVYITGDVRWNNLLKVVVPGELNVVDTANIEEKESSPEEWKNMALDLINKGNIEQAKAIAEKISENEEYYEEIIGALKARECIPRQSHIDDQKKKLQQNEVDTANPEARECISRQSRVGGQKKKLKHNKRLVDIISNDNINEFKRMDTSSYGRQAMLNLSLKNGSLQIANDLSKNFTGKTNSDFIKNVDLLHLAIGAGHKDLVKLLLYSGAAVNSKNEQGFSLLHTAAAAGQKDIAEILLDNGAYINIRNNNLLAEFLESHTIDADVQSELNDLTPLHMAVSKGYKDVVEVLLDRGADVNPSTKVSPLFLAVQENHMDIAELLLNHGADINSESMGFTTLHLAAQNGFTNAAKMLLDRRANVDARSKGGSTPLYMAVENGHYDIVKLLLDCGADFYVSDKDGHTPLHVVAQKGRKDLAEIILDKGADINMKTNLDVTPLFLAAGSENKDLVELFLRRGADVHAKVEDGSTPLFMAAGLGDTNIVKLLVEYGADCNAKAKEGYSPLHVAAQGGYTDVMKILLDNGADINIKNNFGRTPLHLITGKGYKNVVSFLLDCGADVNSKDKNCLTPLSFAVIENREDMVEFLLGRGADANVTDIEGRAHLHCAVGLGHAGIVNILLKNGAIYNLEDKKGKWPIAYCSMNQNVTTRKLLKLIDDLFKDAKEGNVDILNKLKATGPVEFSAVTNARNHRGETLLQVAVGNRHKNIASKLFKMLKDSSQAQLQFNLFSKELLVAIKNDNSAAVKDCINNGVVVDFKDNDGRTPLHHAVDKGNIGIVNILLENGADPTRVTIKGNTPLHIAALKGCKEIVETLLKHVKQTNYDKLSSFVNARTFAKGTSALHVAAKNGYLEIVKLLFDYKANLGIKDENGKTPLDLAQESLNQNPKSDELKEIVRILNLKGCV